MPRPADQPESNSTLPHPELNPLVNPLLGQNMGRWAEVYFTSPPEKREEAVLNLLRELAGDASGTSSNLGMEPPREILQGEPIEEHLPENLAPAQEPERINRQSVDCRSCGAENPADQKFCGQCGSLLASEARVEAESAARSWPSQTLSRNEVASFPSADSAPHQSSYESTYYEGKRTPIQAGSDVETTFAYDNPRELSWLRDVVAPKLMPEYEPVPYRYRIYVGAALAVLMAALVYIAWRGTQASSGNSHALPQAAPSQAPPYPASSQTSPSPVAGSSAKAGLQAGSQNDKTNVAAPPDNKAAGHQASHATTRIDDTTETKKVSTPAFLSTGLPVERPNSVQDNGSRELTVAEGYLTGAPGKIRDSTEAAKWLWQAVRKENASATLILSDLYLRGDGVPKSCDQGRLLLNAAARRGAPGAGERIRNLHAFGCQ